MSDGSGGLGDWSGGLSESIALRHVALVLEI